jgi:hypothetical protein
MSDNQILIWIGGISAGGTLICAVFAFLTWRQGVQRQPKDSTANRQLNLGWFIASAILFTGLLACVGAALYIWIRATYPVVLLVSVVGLVILLVLTWLGVGRLFASNPSQSGRSVQWKPAWQRLQWCNAERERLEGEVSKWKGMYESLQATRAEEPSQAERVFELATKYKHDAREFLRQNPQLPAPPASTAWAAKARAWQAISFHSELKRAMDELVAVGLTDPSLQINLDAPPTLAQVESTTRLLRFMAAQLDDDSSDYQNVRLPEMPITHFVFLNVTSFKVDEKTVSRGTTLKIRYEINSSENVSDGVWLGGTLVYKSGGSFSSQLEDKSISLSKGTGAYDRNFTVPVDAPVGNHTLRSSVWQGVRGDSTKSVVIAKGGSVEIAVVA